MRNRVMIAAALAAVLGFASNILAAGYFVSKQGNDANNGTTQQTAFLTVQKGVDALKPGDTLTIGPGEYFENVAREGLGSGDADTVIRAEIPGTAVLRGDVPLLEFQKVEGSRFTYAVAFDRPPVAVLERGTLTILQKRPTVRDVEYNPGTFYYDEAAKTLYISSSDLVQPGHRLYTAVVNGNNGLDLAGAQRVTIDGLAVGGFASGWGICLNGPVSCTVRNCVVYMCEIGIGLDNGSGNIVEKCESYGHTFGGIVRYRANNDTIRNCRTYGTKPKGPDDEYFGIMHYFNMPGTLLIADNISWGQRFDYSVKPSQNERLERNMALGGVRNSKMFNNLIGGDNEYDRDAKISTPDNILFLREKNLNQDFEFADPLNLDFRLQADSRFRGTGPGGTDRGPYPYRANIFYVSQAGNDEADGLSMRTAWRTLERGLKGLKAGDTLYLAEGTYDGATWENVGDGKALIAIRGRGNDAVVINGQLTITGGAGITLERLNFGGGAALINVGGVTVSNCAFYNKAGGEPHPLPELRAEGCRDLSVLHSLFAEVPLKLSKSEGVSLSGNIYANSIGPAVLLDSTSAIRYSDYNSYQDGARAWEVANEGPLPLASVQKEHDSYSQVRSPDFAVNKGVPVLANAGDFAGRGPNSTALGMHKDLEPASLRLTGPFLHSVSDTTANIEWWTSKPATLELAWGDTPEMTNKVMTVRAPDCFTSYSLTGLTPGKTYYFKILSADTAGRTAGGVVIPPLKPEGEPLSFTTATVALQAATYYVAPDGDDARSGLSRDQAWRTVGHAADTVNAGDTVLVCGGTYAESVRVRATGDEGKPITFKCAPGEKVVFRGENLLQAFKAVVKKHINFDGFYFDTFGDSMGAVFELWGCEHAKITRCFNVKGTGNVSFINAEFGSDILVQNCVSANGFSIARFKVCPDARVENCLFLRPWIFCLDFVNRPEQKAYFIRNIFTDNLPAKVGGATFGIGRFESFVEQDNCYFLRVPDEQKRMFEFYGTAAYARYTEYGITADFDKPPVITDNPDGSENNPRMSLKQYQSMVGDTGSFVGDPKFAGTAGMNAGRGTLFERLLDKRDIDFPDTFATDPRCVEKKIGPQPDAFKDFWFNRK